MPAQSPTLSPTLSAITAGLRGSSSGIPASTLPTRSAPTSAALVKIPPPRSEEHTSELQTLMRNSYGGFCLKKKKKNRKDRYKEKITQYKNKNDNHMSKTTRKQNTITMQKRIQAVNRVKRNN